MNLKCSGLSELKCFSRIRLAAGEKGLDHNITWVYICQVGQISEWIHGGELVFVSGMDGDYTDDMLCRMLQECVENAAAGMVVLCSEEHISRIPEKMLEIADRAGMPLYEMPYDLKLVDVTREIADTIIMNQLREHSTAGFFSELLFSRNISSAAVRQMGIHCGADIDSPATVMIVSLIYNGEDIYRRADYDNALNILCKNLSAFLDAQKISSVSCVYMDEIFIYVNCANNRSASQLCEKIRGICRLFTEKHPDYRIRAGMGRAGSSIEEVRRSYAEARRSLAAAEKNDEPFCVVFFADLGIIRLLINADNMEELRDYCLSVLGPLAESDKNFGTDYVRTLEVYLNCNCSLVAAAEQLFIHRNTMVYRIGKIRELLNTDFSDMNSKAECMNALHILRHFDIDLGND